MDDSTSLWRQRWISWEKILLTRRWSLVCTSDQVQLSKVRVSDFAKVFSRHSLMGLIPRTRDQMTSTLSFSQQYLRSQTKDGFSLPGLASYSFAVKSSSLCHRLRLSTDARALSTPTSLPGPGWPPLALPPWLGGSTYPLCLWRQAQSWMWILQVEQADKSGVDLDLVRPDATRICLHILPPAVMSLFTPSRITSNLLRLPLE